MRLLLCGQGKAGSPRRQPQKRPPARPRHPAALQRRGEQRGRGRPPRPRRRERRRRGPGLAGAGHRCGTASCQLWVWERDDEEKAGGEVRPPKELSTGRIRTLHGRQREYTGAPRSCCSNPPGLSAGNNKPIQCISIVPRGMANTPVFWASSSAAAASAGSAAGAPPACSSAPASGSASAAAGLGLGVRGTLFRLGGVPSPEPPLVGLSTCGCTGGHGNQSEEVSKRKEHRNSRATRCSGHVRRDICRHDTAISQAPLTTQCSHQRFQHITTVEMTPHAWGAVQVPEHLQLSAHLCCVLLHDWLERLGDANNEIFVTYYAVLRQRSCRLSKLGSETRRLSRELSAPGDRIIRMGDVVCPISCSGTHGQRRCFQKAQIGCQPQEALERAPSGSGRRRSAAPRLPDV